MLLTLIIGVLVGLVGNVATSFVQKITGDNRIYLKEELKAEIKDEIVDEALKQLQDLSPEQNSKVDETSEDANQNKE